MALPEQNFVHAHEIRRDAIKREELAAREFPDTWGFLCGPKLEAETHGFRNVIAKYHASQAGWTLRHKRVHDDSALGRMAREIDNKLKPKMGQVLQGTEHRTNIVPGIVDKHGRVLTKTNSGYDCIPTRYAALALRSHAEHTIGDSVRIKGYSPVDKYVYPVTAQHEVGWRPKSLEIFGVAEFGLKKGIAAEHGLK
ncbi:hypothetical protein KFE25_006981 [Diacronema lutheri]|uniref:Uncharacterized protein n=1 Tax=Diacronema lutheri TaxID=2081491 RepID=A0A8J5XX09_DIALT|nr:hypothetical protein KFE25_006981 [Diacronema lutheri]